MTPRRQAASVLNRVAGAAALALVGLAVAVPSAYSTFVHSERFVVIGAHQATVHPDFDGMATIDFGTLIPRMRLPIDAPLGIGVNIRLGDSEVTELNKLIARDAVIASQPEGEIATVRSAVTSMAVDAVLRGAGSGLIVVVLIAVAYRAIGGQRRAVLWQSVRRPSRRQGLTAGAISMTLVAGVAMVAAPERPRADESQWEPIRAAFPLLPENEVLDSVEIVQGASTAGSKALVQGALDTYNASVNFYGKMTTTARNTVVRTPREGQTTALVVTDRHDNIGMDPVARQIADAAGASLLIDLGDDTSNGAAWEAFSINSLAEQFSGFDVVAVAGNHDNGDSVANQMVEKGFTLLDGEPVDVGGVRFIGSSDPRSSGLTAGYDGKPASNAELLRQQDEALMQAACADGNVSVVAVHSPSSAKRTAASGCVDLVLSGHLHRQEGPEATTADNGETTWTLTTGSTGGAVYAFALGSKLRRTAQATIITFQEGRPVGLQVVDFEPGGKVTPQRYVPLRRPKAR